MAKRGDTTNRLLKSRSSKHLLWSNVTQLVLRRRGVGVVLMLRESRVGPGFRGNKFGCLSLNVLVHFPQLPPSPSASESLKFSVQSLLRKSISRCSPKSAMDALTFLGLDRIENRIYDIWCERYYLHSTFKKAFDALRAHASFELLSSTSPLTIFISSLMSTFSN